MWITRRRGRDGTTKDTSWTKLFGEGVLALLGWDLTLVEWRVLLYLVATAKVGTNVAPCARAAAIAQALGHDRTSVSRALTALAGMHLVRMGVEASGAQVAEVNPHVAFRGTPAQRGLAIGEGRWHHPVNTRGDGASSR